jgi:NAD(P)-dependent dehydrogenase (short-subunit alcohol dehydrogenase family)
MTTVVTGSASGIGAAVRARLEADGEQVVGVDLRDAEVVADLATREGREEAVRRVRELSGDDLAGAVTCAGLGPLPGRPAELLVSLNAFGTTEVLEGLKPALQPGSSVVAISSNSTTCQPGVPLTVVEACLAGDEEATRQAAAAVPTMDGVYPATKTAVARWVRRRAPGWLADGVRLNAVAPGLVETAMTVEMRSDAVVAPLLEAFPLPMGRGATPDELASVVTWLLGPQSAVVVGSLVVCDGGTEALLRPDDVPPLWHPR